MMVLGDLRYQSDNETFPSPHFLARRTFRTRDTTAQALAACWVGSSPAAAPIISLYDSTASMIFRELFRNVPSDFCWYASYFCPVTLMISSSSSFEVAFLSFESEELCMLDKFCRRLSSSWSWAACHKSRGWNVLVVLFDWVSWIAG